MSFVDNSMILKGFQRGIVAVALGLGMMASLADAAPISPGSIRSEETAAPIEKTVVVVHHHRRPVVVHHHRRPVVVHHRRHQHCWWSHGRRVCRWR